MSLMNEENPGGNDLAKRLMRRVGRSAALPFRRMGLPFGANDSRIKALRNCHAGRRAFVIANGPSLRVEDLDLLRNEITFASNKIFLAFDSTPWRPTYYFASDKLVGRNNAEIIRNLPLTKLLSDQIREYVGSEGASIWLHELPVPRNASPRASSRNSAPSIPFSEDAMVGVYGGGTVVYPQLQVAYYMGITEVILVGLDFKFTVPEQTVTTDIRGYERALRSSGEVNHFHPEYRKPGEIWGIPNLDVLRRSFTAGLEQYRAAGRTIINASRRSECDVFPRRALEEVL